MKGKYGARQTVAIRCAALRSSRTACRSCLAGASAGGWRGLSGGGRDFAFRMTHPVATQPALDGALRLAESTWLVFLTGHRSKQQSRSVTVTLFWLPLKRERQSSEREENDACKKKVKFYYDSNVSLSSQIPPRKNIIKKIRAV